MKNICFTEGVARGCTGGALGARAPSGQGKIVGVIYRGKL